MKEFLTKKEFAEYSRRSLATIDRLIDSNKIHVEESGLIASAQLSIFFRDDLLSHSKDNVLIIYTDDKDVSLNDEQKDALGVSQKKEFANTCEVFQKMNEMQIGCAESDSDKILVEFKKSILDTFISRYNAGVSRAVQAFITSVTNDTEQYRDVAQLPIIVVADIIRYGTIKNIIGYNDSEVSSYSAMIDRVSTKVSKKDGLEYKTTNMDNLFEKVMSDLGLVGRQNSTLFNRDALTPDFFKKCGVLYNKIIDDSGLNDRLIEQIKTNKALESLWDKSVIKVVGAKTKMSVNKMLSNGIYTIKNVKADKISYKDTIMLVDDINQGYYKNVFVLGRNIEEAGDVIKFTITSAQLTKKIKVDCVQF